MNTWPTWIPKPNSWMNAILLILLARGISVIIELIFQMGDSMMEISLKWRIVLYFLALLSPILVISVAHHVLHIVLDRYFPNTRSPEIGRVEGLLPSLMSWWEGLYGWLAIALALLISSALQVILLPQFNSLYNLLDLGDEIKNFFSLPTLYRVVTAAYLYQFEHLVRHHLMSVGSASRSNQL